MFERKTLTVKVYLQIKNTICFILFLAGHRRCYTYINILYKATSEYIVHNLNEKFKHMHYQSLITLCTFSWLTYVLYPIALEAIKNTQSSYRRWRKKKFSGLE